MLGFVRRWLGLLLISSILVVFSEKVFWYAPVDNTLGLALFYTLPTYFCLWAVDYFKADETAPIILIASMYAFLIEGVLTPVLYEAGLFDPIMPSYFIGWHGLLAFFFGWYLLRRWLATGVKLKLITGGLVVGAFWGAWSVSNWRSAEGMAGVTAGVQWTPLRFLGYALILYLVLVGAHWSLARLNGTGRFRPSRVEAFLMFGLLIAYFAVTALPVRPLAVFKLPSLVALVLLPLFVHRARVKTSKSANTSAASIQLPAMAALLSLPLAAAGVYWLCWRFLAVEGESVTLIIELTPLVQSLIGAGFFLWGIAATLVGAKRNARRSGLMSTERSLASH